MFSKNIFLYVVNLFVYAVFCVYAYPYQNTSQIVKNFQELSKSSPLVVVQTHPLNCAPNVKPSFFKELKHELKNMNPPVALFEFRYNEAKYDDECDGYVMLHWKEERISYYKGDMETEQIMVWVDQHVYTGQGHVINIEDDDNLVVQKVTKIAVFATIDHRCKDRLQKTLDKFRSVAEEIAKQRPDILMFQYVSKILFVRNAKPVCYALPVYMYLGPKNIGKEKFFESNIQGKLLKWILEKASAVRKKPTRKPPVAKPYETQPSPEEALTGPDDKPKSVIEISDEKEYDKAIAPDAPDTVVAFLYKSCPASKDFSSVYDDVWETVKKKGIPLRLVRVLAKKNPYILYKHTFGALPILQFYKKGQIISKMTGSTNKEKIVNWINEKMKATAKDDRSDHLKARIDDDKGVLMLDDKTFERAMTENKLLIVVYSPPIGFGSLTKIMRELGENLRDERIPIKVANKDDTFLIEAQEKKKLYPLIVLYKNGRGFAHKVKEEQYTAIEDFVKDALKKINFTKTDKNDDLTLRTETITDDVLIMNNHEAFQKVKAANPFVLLASYPQGCCKEFFAVYREIASELKMKAGSNKTKGLEKMQFLELLDAFELDNKNKDPYIDLNLFINQTTRNFRLIYTGNKEYKKQSVIKWVTESLERATKK